MTMSQLSQVTQKTLFLKPGRRLVIPFVCAAVLLSFFVPIPAAAALPTGYQEYYVLGYEEHIWRAFLAINDGDDSAIQPGHICSTVSLVATADHQVVYYDHWEDGYEADLLNPTQDTTEIYGDGDTDNGGTGSDILLAGDDINLTSNQDITGTTVITGYVPVNPARNPADIRYDGGDRIITSGGPVDVAHAMWPLNESWVGGAWEVYSRQTFAGTHSYRLPIGEDLYSFGGGNFGAYGDFRNVYLQLGVFEDNTTVSISNDTGLINLTLDRGQTYSSMGYINSSPALSITINASTAIRSNKPVQVGLATGADGSFQGRFLIVLPDQQWGADYVVPVPSGGPGEEAEVYLANPNDFPILINAYDRETQTSFVIGPMAYISSTVPYSEKRGGLGYVPADSAARFTSPDGVFGVVVCADTSTTFYDWGFSGVPAKYLTRDYYVSWAPGDYNTPPQNNGSPVWVTPLADGTTFYVDYSPLDGVVDETFALDVLQQRRIFDPDNDNTGMHVWATGEFAVAWGEDPRTAGSSVPYLDLGVSTLPLIQRWLDPVLTLDKTGEPTILPPTGGTVTFTLVTQAHDAPLVNVDITDTLPISWTYVPNSAHVTYPNGSTGNPDPTVNGQTLSWDLSTGLDLDQGLTLTFQAQITSTSAVTVCVNQGEAAGTHEYSGALFNPRDEATVYVGPLNLVKSVNSAQAEIGDTLVYTLSYANVSSSTTITNVVLRDVVPAQYTTFQSASDGGAYDGASSAITWTLGTLAPQDNGIVTFTATVNDFVEDGTVIENVGYINSDQTMEAGSNVVRTTVGAADVKFSKSGPTAAGQEQVITYILSYENAGGAQATGVTIQDTIPVSTTYVAGSLAIDTGGGWVTLTDAADGDQGAYISPTLIITPGAIAAGEAGQVRFSVQLEDDLSPGSLILNSAMLDRDLDIPRESNLVVTRISDLLINKASEQAAVAPGEVISYTLTYENVSEATAQTSVYVREPIPDYTRFISGTVYGGDQVAYSWDNGATWIPTLPITPVTHIRWYDAEVPTHTQVTVGFAVRVNAVLPEGTTIQNMAHVSSTQTAGYIREWIPSNQVEVGTVGLWVEKSASQPSARAGDLISYTVSYGNRGSADAAGVQILDTVPASATYSTGSIWGSGADASGALDLLWNVGTVAAGASAQQVGYAVVLDSSLLPGAVITNTAAISSAHGLEASDPVTVTVTATAADLAVAKSDNPDPVDAGETLTYTLSIANYGPSDAQNVTITDTLPVSVTYGGMVSVTPSLLGPTRTGQLLTWYTPTLAAGASGDIVFTVTVNADASGTLTNDVVVASATHDPNPGDNDDGEPTDIIAFPLTIIYGAVFNDANGNGVFDESETGIPGVRVTLDGLITVTTDLGGNYTFSTTVVGMHTVLETDPTVYIPPFFGKNLVSPTDLPGYFSTTSNEVHVDVTLGRDHQADFGDALTDSGFASIYGTVFSDAEGDGVWSAVEPGIAGTLVTLDGGITTTTDLYGSYTFSTTVSGVHNIVETDPGGYFSTTPNKVHVDGILGVGYRVEYGDALTSSGFVPIYGSVFNDANGNGVYGGSEGGVPGVTITLDVDTTATTGPYGGYTLSTTVTGTHTIVETNPDGYFSTTPDQLPVTVTWGSSYQVDFGDVEMGDCDPDIYEDDDTADIAYWFIVGTSQAHQFCDDDIDWTEFAATADTIYTITTSSWGPRADTFLALFDTDAHTLLADNDDYEGTTDRSSRIVWSAPSDGIYYVRITNQGTLTGSHTNYNLVIGGEDVSIIYLPIVMQSYDGGEYESRSGSCTNLASVLNCKRWELRYTAYSSRLLRGLYPKEDTE